MIEAHELSRSFGSLRAVDAVSLRVEAGEVVGLLGVNGAGKTTLLRMLGGLLRPSAGRVTVGGHPLEGDALAARRSLGWVGDTPSLFDVLSPAEHLDIAAGLHRIGAPAARIGEVVRQLGLGDFLGSPAGALSRGQRQRVALALALLHRPGALLLDEPFLGLDPPGRRFLAELLVLNGRQGRAVLVSSHELSLLESACTRFVAIHRGALAWQGTLEELRRSLGARRTAVSRAGGVLTGDSLEDLFLERLAAEEEGT